MADNGSPAGYADQPDEVVSYVDAHDNETLFDALTYKLMLGLLPPGDQPVDVATAIARELELVGSFRFNDEIDAVLAALTDGSLAVDPVITHEYPVTDALAALATAADPRRSGKVLLTFHDDHPDKP